MVNWERPPPICAGGGGKALTLQMLHNLQTHICSHTSTHLECTQSYVTDTHKKLKQLCYGSLYVDLLKLNTECAVCLKLTTGQPTMHPHPPCPHACPQNYHKHSLHVQCLAYNISTVTYVQCLAYNISTVMYVQCLAYNISTVMYAQCLAYNISTVMYVQCLAYNISTVTYVQCLAYNISAVMYVQCLAYNISTVTYVQCLAYNISAVMYVQCLAYNISTVMYVQCLAYNISTVTYVQCSAYNISTVTYVQCLAYNIYIICEWVHTGSLTQFIEMTILLNNTDKMEINSCLRRRGLCKAHTVHQCINIDRAIHILLKAPAEMLRTVHSCTILPLRLPDVCNTYLSVSFQRTNFMSF